MNALHTPTDRIDADHYETSPSTGWRETARVLDAVDGIGEVVA